MNDRELLEMVAKAAGIPVEWDGDGFVRPVPFKEFTNYEPWNPLTDDGDALRLAVKLNLEIVNDRFVVISRTGMPRNIGVIESLSNDPYAATRRAIVRAAYEIGKSTP